MLYFLIKIAALPPVTPFCGCPFLPSLFSPPILRDSAYRMSSTIHFYNLKQFSIISTFPQDWALGAMYTKITVALTFMGPDWWLKESIEQLYQDGIRSDSQIAFMIDMFVSGT